MHFLVRKWWALALRGLAAIIFGVLTFLMPGITLVALVMLFGAYALVDGILSVIASFRGVAHHWALLIEGVIGIFAGIITFLWPGITTFALLYVIAFWAILTGILEIAAGVRLRQVITNEWLYILMGIASVAFGVLLVIAPVAGALAIVLWIGAYALFFGILMIALAFRVRGHGRQLPGHTPHMRPVT